MKRVIFLFAFSFLLNSCSLIFKFQGKEGDADVGEDMGLYEFSDLEVSDYDVLNDRMEVLPDKNSNDYEKAEIEEVEIEIPPTCGNGNVDEGEECDDWRNGNPDDGCKDDCTFSCHSNDECDDGHDCTSNLCITSTHTCNFSFLLSGTICRPSGGDCDVAEYCDGVNPDWPPDITGLSGVSAISAGGSHTCALMSSDGVKCWGYNSNGQVGDGTYGNTRTTPVDVSGLSSGVSAISAGWRHTCAITTTGGAKCWGYNNLGQVGDGSTINRTTPVDVLGLISGVSAISAGGHFTCALTSGGGVKCWGSNENGQLGNGRSGSGEKSNTPVDVSGLSSGVSAISAGNSHTCALLNSGGVKCWGDNQYGQIGDGTNIDRNTPANVLGISSDVIAISAGDYHTCALLISGGVKCWGKGDYGQLGNGSSGDSNTPVNVQGLLSGVSAISAGGEHTCALLSSGGVQCWGSNENGQLGNGRSGYGEKSDTPVDVSGLSSGVLAISAGNSHTCALLNSGEVKCWGGNSFGQLGDQTTELRTTPVSVCP